MTDKTEFLYLEETEAYINPAAIRWVEKTSRGLVLSLSGRDQPVMVTGEDADKIINYLQDHSL